MRKNFFQVRNTKVFHMCMVATIVVVILFSLGIVALKYNVEGETNMPFEIDKITIISSSEGKDKETNGHKWAFDVNQNNDIYIYLNQNKKYGKKEIIKSILVDNIQINKNTKQGNIKIYAPNVLEQGGVFYNSEENLVGNIEYKGAMETNFKTKEIANQGGILAFRIANNNITEIISDEDIINHQELLKKSGIKEEDLKIKVSFDFTIKVESGKEYKTTIEQELPIQGIIENGTTHTEIKNEGNIIFKRIKN